MNVNLYLHDIQPRKWRSGFSAAIDVYRRMIRLEEELRSAMLQLTPVEQLAENCPPCFGPSVPGKSEHEPDVIICLDGNFQHQRNLSASKESSSIAINYPPLFLHPTQLEIWKQKIEYLHGNRAQAAVINPVDRFIVSVVFAITS